MSHYNQICLEATSAEASKKYAVGLEEKINASRAKILSLEAALEEAQATAKKANKEAELAISTRNKVAAAYEKQKLELAAKCAEVETLSTKVEVYTDVNKELKAVEWAAKERVEKAEKTLVRFQSQDYVDTIISEF